MNSFAAKTLIVIALFAIPTVMFGGFSLLRLRAAQRLTEFQAAYFRAGHAHAGVLLTLSLLAIDIADRFALSSTVIWTVGVALIAGTLAQSGGMFIHMGIGRPGKWSWGNTITSIGGLLLAAGLITLAIAVIQK